MDAVRQLAWQASADRRTSPEDPWAGSIGAEAPASDAAPPPPPQGGRSKSNYVAPLPGENRDAVILAKLATWTWPPGGKVTNRLPNEVGLIGTRGLTRREIDFLDRMLQRGGLRPFLQRHDAYFKFGPTPSKKGIWFRYVPKGGAASGSAAAPPGTGAAGVSAAAPPATGAAGVSTAAPPAAQRAQGSTGAAGVAAGQGSVVFAARAKRSGGGGRRCRHPACPGQRRRNRPARPRCYGGGRWGGGRLCCRPVWHRGAWRPSRGRFHDQLGREVGRRPAIAEGGWRGHEGGRRLRSRPHRPRSARRPGSELS